MRAAIVLAGGQARRLGGVDKALVEIDGVTMLDRVLAAAAPNCDRLVVVGPPRATTVADVRFTMEAEPGGGPVPAVAAGLAEVPNADTILVLAVDLALLAPEHVEVLIAGLGDDTVDAVAAQDHHGQPNPLLAAYRGDVLRATVGSLSRDMAAARLLPDATAVVDFAQAGMLNVNEPSDVERAERAVHDQILRARPKREP
jgi:molybdopterin-guanine dinucleotide biosynthesis protein A